MDALIVRSAIFSVRNTDKTENGQIGRATVAAGQAKKVLDYISKLDNTIGKETSEALTALKSASKNDKILKYAGKVIDFSSKNINPLICASSAIDVLRADNPEEKLITDTTALATMFGVEHLMKKHLEKAFTKGEEKLLASKGKFEILDKALNALSKFKYAKKISPLAQGVAFVIGSCSAYTVGEKFGNLLVNRNKQKLQTNETQPTKSA